MVEEGVLECRDCARDEVPGPGIAMQGGVVRRGVLEAGRCGVCLGWVIGEDEASQKGCRRKITVLRQHSSCKRGADTMADMYDGIECREVEWLGRVRGGVGWR